MMNRHKQRNWKPGDKRGSRVALLTSLKSSVLCPDVVPRRCRLNQSKMCSTLPSRQLPPLQQSEPQSDERPFILLDDRLFINCIVTSMLFAKPILMSNQMSLGDLVAGISRACR